LRFRAIASVRETASGKLALILILSWAMGMSRVMFLIVEDLDHALLMAPCSAWLMVACRLRSHRKF
jgi:hypothetical protein